MSIGHADGGPAPGLEGFRHLVGHLDPARQEVLLGLVRAVLEAAPLYAPTMPRTGKPFSVRMSNCGPLGWVSDKEGGTATRPTIPRRGGRGLPSPTCCSRSGARLEAILLCPRLA